MTDLRTAFAAVLALALCDPAFGQPRISVTPIDEPEIVFRPSRDGCARDDYPDSAARAIRDEAGTIRLFATHDTNRALVGESLDRLKPDCRVVFKASGSNQHELFDDRSWLSALYTTDGKTIHALVHTEFQGHLRPAICPSRRYLSCWNNAITAAISRDGGRSFSRADPPGHLVATLPYRYEPDLGKQVGHFNPTNIIAHDGHYYAMFTTAAHRDQAWGACVMRTDRLDDPRAWRAWDGRGYNVRFADPYREAIADPAAHVCATVGRGRLTTPLSSLVRHAPSGAFVLMFAGRLVLAQGAPPVTGVFAATSRDLIAWSAPHVVWEAPILGLPDCARDHVVYYPALIDPDSTTPSFETTDDEAYVYFTRLSLSQCRVSNDRDLMRRKVRLALTPG